MLAYWFLLLIPALFSLKAPRARWTNWQAILLCTSLSLFVGLRHEVGGDWFAYIPYLTRAQGFTLFQAISEWGDPGYNTLNWLFTYQPWGIYAVNLISSIIFAIGLISFCRSQPRPWLALSLAVPYLIIVVGMGYSRQAVALGLVMPGLVALERGLLRRFFLFIACAATFHSTALVMMIFTIPAIPGRKLSMRLLRLIIFLLVLFALGQTFLSSRIDSLVENYIVADYSSEGAAIRASMNLLPALIFLLRPSRFSCLPQQLRLWRSMSLCAVGLALLLVMMPSNSTAIDRISLYVIPLQLFVGSRLPSSGFLGLSPRTLLVSATVYAISVQFVWLNFASHAGSWLPYSNYLFL